MGVKWGFNVSTGASSGQGRAQDIRVSKLQRVRLHGVSTVKNCSMGKKKKEKKGQSGRLAGQHYWWCSVTINAD